MDSQIVRNLIYENEKLVYHRCIKYCTTRVYRIKNCEHFRWAPRIFFFALRLFTKCKERYNFRTKIHWFLKYTKQCIQKRKWHRCTFFFFCCYNYYIKRKVIGVDSLVYLYRILLWRMILKTFPNEILMI